MSKILFSPKNLYWKPIADIEKEDDARLPNCVNAHVAAWKGAKYEANLFILNNGSKWTTLYTVKRANNWEATGTEKHQSLVRSPPLFLGSWSRFSAVKSHENPTPTRNYLMSEPVIYPFIELPISIERRTLTSDDFLVDKYEEINAIILLQ